ERERELEHSFCNRVISDGETGDPVLSVVIPVYNLENYIGRCLDSLMDQDIDPASYEIICINDGSKDGTYDILESYKNKYPNIKVFHGENRGVVLARSAGLEKASGKYIWFVDGDDWIEKNCLKYLCDIVLADDSDLLLFKEKRVYEYCTSDVDLQAYKPTYCSGGYRVFDSHYTTGSGFYWFRKDILDQYNIRFRPDVYYSDDTLFIAKFKARCRKMALTEAPVYYYFQRADSVSHKVNYSRHCGCMYKLAKEYTALKQMTFENYDGTDTNARMATAALRAMQSCVRSMLMFCQDRKFLKAFLKRAKAEKLYPYGVDWKQFRIDKRQSRKNDLLNWIFGLTSFEPYLWLVWCLWTPMRKKAGVTTYNMEDFEDNY
ncbi:MAG: glycosyltransferase, partial [Oscillospiraceae bacterium]|nr:glycosyltransferase [Oscillospiraceae bacterium]